jgi:hypothetical protein
MSDRLGLPALNMGHLSGQPAWVACSTAEESQSASGSDSYGSGELWIAVGTE